MSSLYNMGNLTAVKEFFFWGGGVEWGMHEGVVVVGEGMGGGYDWTQLMAQSFLGVRRKYQTLSCPWGSPNQKDGFLKNKNSNEVWQSHFVDVAYMVLKQQINQYW